MPRSTLRSPQHLSRMVRRHHQASSIHFSARLFPCHSARDRGGAKRAPSTHFGAKTAAKASVWERQVPRAVRGTCWELSPACPHGRTALSGSALPSAGVQHPCTLRLPPLSSRGTGFPSLQSPKRGFTVSCPQNSWNCAPTLKDI